MEKNPLEIVKSTEEKSLRLFGEASAEKEKRIRQAGERAEALVLEAEKSARPDAAKKYREEINNHLKETEKTKRDTSETIQKIQQGAEKKFEKAVGFVIEKILTVR
ncbi:MAG: hypothetical protein ABIJ11_07645 [Elusimicrobiota bacterium]